MEQSINDELLTRYLANEVTASEQTLVDNWVADSEANRQYLDSLRQIWQLAAARPLLEMDIEEKWRQFRQIQEGVHAGERTNFRAGEHPEKEKGFNERELPEKEEKFSEREHPEKEKEPVNEKVFTSSNTRRMKNKVYLSPGQEFIYGPQISVRSFLLQQPAVTKDNHPAEDPYIASGEESNWYMFNNQSLEEVLNQLEAIYKVKIIYNKADVQDIYFTARYERTESLIAILQRIAKLNNLKITDNDSVMIIKK